MDTSSAGWVDLPPIADHPQSTGGMARLHVLYQPIVRLRDGAPIAVEALARLDHPAEGALSPDDFVPRLEDAGLVRGLTEKVAVQALAAETRYLAPLGLGLGLNVPLDILLADAVLCRLDELRRAAGTEAGHVTIELTERDPVEALDTAERNALRAAIVRLRGIGYRLAIDDIGPEMADPTALFDFGFTAAKLDKSAVAASGRNRGDRRFLAGIIASAKAAGMFVIAEGVESDAGWHRMRMMGVDAVQGFLVARPLPSAALSGWIESWRAPHTQSALRPDDQTSR